LEFKGIAMARIIRDRNTESELKNQAIEILNFHEEEINDDQNTFNFKIYFTSDPSEDGHSDIRMKNVFFIIWKISKKHF
jgi:hypothetical protein